MRKLATALVLPALLLGANAQADTILGIYAGGQYWDTSNSGNFGSGNGTQGFNFADETQNSFYVALEHPIPLLPNFKVRRNDLTTYGVTTLGSDFSYNGIGYSAGTTLNSSVDLTHTDYTLYYEIFDNDLLSVDLGITAKQVDGLLAVRDATAENSLDADGWIPTGYAQVRVGIPATDLTLYGLANAVSIDDSSVRDIEAGIEYRLVDSLAVNLNLQLGYRDITIELDDLDNIYSDIQFKGPYLGLEIHF
ncbi:MULTISPECIES: TIGR04219 family outer membrane beta-barrel protein [Idiomarinaceae]|uniref:Outer membrane protein n=4 Tax=Pseudidiomarina TaxID=2800384 RepID=A0A368UV34_9GAMM|nr:MULTISPECIES: TIGR04219 family outer membrane beta-barrel protein [Idiomarinaceae]MDT7525742.1 TIGR04219 family outer membrane beta-barrel protein [Pseudidiomarina sp. GXY010]MDX1525608.1 TIGR04219 family outer membrane beta-barrel protein [Pseudidiomarina maritima]MRJ42522.1 TIGR04219 family outer membrane beta-barrel protein [Idiomarina sp. FeN1]NCU58136.1 TIGR04219 family outer membrane beta-barrel protein [Idiomarina sp. FenA--70]NCU60834.1 TIGR04219 family outer membrane beta-barrel pr